MRISEETDRRQREALIHERLPLALEEVHNALARCVETYREAFGTDSAEVRSEGSTRLRVLVREQQNGRWQESGVVDIKIDNTIPGFHVDRSGDPLVLEVGILPGDRVFYRDPEKDQYLTMDDLTRRILDRCFFPKLTPA